MRHIFWAHDADYILSMRLPTRPAEDCFVAWNYERNFGQASMDPESGRSAGISLSPVLLRFRPPPELRCGLRSRGSMRREEAGHGVVGDKSGREEMKRWAAWTRKEKDEMKWRLFYFYIFRKHFLQKYIFNFTIYSFIPLPPARGAAGSRQGLPRK